MNGYYDSSLRYIIISDIECKDFNCPGYIQRVLSSPTGTRLIVRVHSPTDQDGMGIEHCLNVDQVASISKTLFHRLLNQIISARKIHEDEGKNMKLNELGEYIANKYTRDSEKNFLNREWLTGNSDDGYKTKVDYNGISRRSNTMKYGIKEIIYNDAATIVYWTDGTKTVVKCNENDEYSEYSGFVAAVAKKMYGGANAINRLIDSKKTIRGNGLGQPFRSKKTFEEILNEAAEKVAKEYGELPPDPLEHPELHSR